MIVVVTGMHRSGTSLMASYLHGNGVFMGNSLVGPGPGNRLGHYEDKEFVRLHQDMLRANGSHLLVPRKRMGVGCEHRERAERLIAERGPGSWGWKDPRTALFLGFWAGLLPFAQFVCVYRSPLAVIDSLLRRGTDRSIRCWPWLAARSWVTYNQRILDFIRQHRTRAVLINIDRFNEHPKRSEKRLADRLGISVQTPYGEYLKPGEMAGRCERVRRRTRAVGISHGRALARLKDALDEHADI